MRIDGLQGSTIVDFVAHQKRRDEKRAAKQITIAPGVTEFRSEDLVPAPVKSFTAEEVLAAARHIVDLYSADGALLSAYLKDQRKTLSPETERDFHKWVELQQRIVEKYKPQDLWNTLEDYLRKPDVYFRIFAVCVSSEFLKRGALKVI